LCYLHASDTWLFPKRSIDDAAILSSTIHLSMGSGCVPVARDSNFLFGVRDAVLHYSDESEFEEKLMQALDQGEEWRRAKFAAKRFVEEHEATKIARQFIHLFESLKD